MFSFAMSTDERVRIFLSCDPEVEGTDEQKLEYVRTGDPGDLKAGEVSWFVIRPLSTTELLQVERDAGVKPHMGSLLHDEFWQIEEAKDRARFLDNIKGRERKAFDDYTDYQQRIRREYIKRSAVMEGIDEDILSVIDRIRPIAAQGTVIQELYIRIRDLSHLEKKTADTLKLVSG